MISRHGMISLVIPANDRTCLAACVDAVRRNETLFDMFNTVVVTDGDDHMADFISDSIDVVTGRRPFCFARNVNLGICAGAGVLILNQDALLETPRGFSSLVAAADARPEYGIVSAAIRGACCNPAQEYAAGSLSSHAMVDTDLTVAFVAVYLPKRTIDRIGLLDERLTGYGREDDVYCLKARQAGLKLGVWHGCVVEHQSLPSAYRSRPDCGELADHNLRVFAEIVKEEGLEPWLSADQKAAIARGHNV